MAELKIISETEIETYATPNTKIRQRVITYQAEGFAPRTMWIDADKLADAVWLKANPGKPVPAAELAKGDAIRRATAEADIAKLKQAVAPRKI